MTRIRSILRALMLIGLSCHSSLALGPNDAAECCLHPDPHIYSFHGIGYDYQHGCDNILVDLPNLKVHARFVKYGFTPSTGFSYIEGVGIESGADNLYIEAGGTYFINDPTMAAPIVAVPGGFAPLGTLPFSINALPTTSGGGVEYVIEFPNVVGFPTGSFAIRVEDYSMLSTGGDLDYGVSMCITGHGSFFGGSTGMCGTWNQFTGLHDRNGNDMFSTLTTTSPWSTVLDGGPFGDHWQSTSTEAIMPPAAGIPGGHNMWPDACVARRRSLAEEEKEKEIVDEQKEMKKELAVVDEEENRDLSITCAYCKTLNHPYAIDNCQYDANVLGCSEVKSTFKMFYNNKSRYYKSKYKKLSPIPCEKFYPDAMYSHTKCAKKKGRCVRYCDTRDKRFKCISGWCNECKFPLGTGQTVLVLNRYINDCSCMIRKKGDWYTTDPDEADPDEAEVNDP